jgi:Zn-dependent alcohol dehydrogenase
VDVQAAIVEDIDKISIRTLQLDEPRAGEVLVRLVATGICHTDLSMLRGNLPVPSPFVPGHEGAGVVEAVGPGVTSPKVGDHVICSIVIPCGQCFMCARGQMPCENSGAVGFAGTMMDGTVRLHRGGEDVNHVFCQSSFADHTVVPAAAAIPIRPDAPLDKVAALGCGVGTGLGAAIHRAKVTPGSTVLVAGAGGVGIAAMLGARLVGAAKIIAVDIATNKLARAAEIVATHTINSREVDLGDAVDALTEGRGADFAIDCAGVEGTLESCFRATRPGGTCVAVGLMHATTTSEIDTFSLLMEKTLTGTYGGSLSPRRDIPAFVDLFMDGRLDLGSLVDREVKLAEVGSALDDLEQGSFTRGVIIQ